MISTLFVRLDRRDLGDKALIPYHPVWHPSTRASGPREFGGKEEAAPGMEPGTSRWEVDGRRKKKANSGCDGQASGHALLENGIWQAKIFQATQAMCGGSSEIAKVYCSA